MKAKPIELTGKEKDILELMVRSSTAEQRQVYHGLPEYSFSFTFEMTWEGAGKIMSFAQNSAEKSNN